MARPNGALNDKAKASANIKFTLHTGNNVLNPTEFVI